MRLLLLITIVLMTLSAHSAERVYFLSLDQVEELSLNDTTVVKQDRTKRTQVRFKKLKVVLLTIFLGHFGVHRIYLGTKANVPVVYSLTLGGGLGMLPLIDLFHIIFSKDLSRFENNNKVIMWNKE